MLPALGFALFATADRAQRIDGGDSPDGAGGEAGLEYLAVRAEGEIRRVNDAAPFFPVGADTVGIFRYFEAITDGKCRAGLCDHLLGFIEWID